MKTSPVSVPELLARIAFLEGAPAELLARFAAAARWIDAPPGTTLIDFDDVTTDVFFIVQGTVRVLVRTADGNRTNIFTDCHAGDLVGELAAIDSAPRSAHVEAVVRSQLCAVSAAAFLDVALSCPTVGLRLLRMLAKRIRTQSSRLLEHAVLPTRMRLVAELLRLGRPKADGTSVISPPPTHDELAARIGTRRETVSRDLAGFDRDGLTLRTRTAIVLLKPVTLRGLVEAGLDQPG
jgi:CRP-like cAMP-binding protein